MSSKDIPNLTEGDLCRSNEKNELYDDSKNINAEHADMKTLFDDMKDYSPYGYSIFPMENELLVEPDVHPGLGSRSSESSPLMSVYNVCAEDNNRIPSKLLNDGMTYNSELPFSSLKGISHGEHEIKSATNPNTIYSDSYNLEADAVNESSVLRNAAIIPASRSFSSKDGSIPLHSIPLKDVDVSHYNSVDLLSKTFFNIDCRSDDDNDSSANLSSHSYVGEPKKVQNSELELLVINTCKDILTGAIQQSLKAVELANTLRARLGTETMGQIREKCGGLLSLLERYHNMFRVQRIPKNDFVSLLSGGTNEIDNALQYIPAEAVSTSCLHVGNVPTNYDEEKLREEFELYGSVESVNIITQRNRRFAFVSFHSVENASQAKLMLSRKHPWKSAISFARKEHPSKANSTTNATTQRPLENSSAKYENPPQDKITNLNHGAAATPSLQSSLSFNSSSINYFDKLTQRESFSNYIASHHQGESFSAPPFLSQRSKYTGMPRHSSGVTSGSNRPTKNPTDTTTTGYQPAAAPYNYSEQLSMARSGSHSSSLSAQFRSSQVANNSTDNSLLINRGDRYPGQDKPAGGELSQSQRTLSFLQTRNDTGNHRSSEFSSVIPAYRPQTQRFDPAMNRNMSFSRSNSISISNSNSSSGNSLMNDFQVRGSYTADPAALTSFPTTTKPSYAANDYSHSRFEGRPADETLSYENELPFTDSAASSGSTSNYLFLQSQHKQQSPYHTSYLSASPENLRSLQRRAHAMPTSEIIESSYRPDTFISNDSNRLIAEYEYDSSPTNYSNNNFDEYIEDYQTNTVYNNRDHRTVATKSRGPYNPIPQYNNNNSNLLLKANSYLNSTYALPELTLRPLHKLSDRSFVNPRPWEKDTEEDLPYCELLQKILAEQGGASTILKITDTLSALFQCNIQLLAVKAMLESYPQYFAISGSRVNLVTHLSGIRK